MQRLKNKGCLIHIYRFTRCSPFWFLNAFKYLPVQISTRLVAASICIHVFCYLLTELICFSIFKSSVQLSSFLYIEILSFAFCLYLEAVAQRCSCKKGFLRYFAKFTEKHLCQSLLFNKVAGLRCFPANFGKFLRAPFLTEHTWWLLRYTKGCVHYNVFISLCKLFWFLR